jgi:two-component system chemotaxis response regulator CheB
MASALTRRNAEVSLRALALGATDYIPKPDTTHDSSDARTFRHDLVEKIRALGTRRRRFAKERQTPATLVPASGPLSTGPDAGERPPIKLRPFPAVAPRVLLIGASTGGPQALYVLASGLNRVIDSAPVLITQHMPPTFTSILAEQLARASGRETREGKDGELVRAWRIYVAPGGRHMRVVRRDGLAVIALDDGAPVNFCKPSVDPLFTSAAEVWGGWNAAVVLTGMGSDGNRGAAAIVAHGGCVIAQDEASSVVWGMPGVVAQAGLCSAVLPLDAMAPAIVRLFCGARK